MATRWLGLGLAWTVLALTFISPSLAVVIRGLPNDHYHAFADPMVFVLVGIGAAALWRAVPRGVPATGPVVACPDARSAPGRGGHARGRRVGPGAPAPGDQPGPGLSRRAGRGRADRGRGWAGPDRAPVDPRLQVRRGVCLSTRPRRARHRVRRATGDAAGGPGRSAGGSVVVMVCDRLFEAVIGAACGGAAEAQLVRSCDSRARRPVRCLTGRVISVYRRPRRVRVSGIANAGAPNAGVRSSPDLDREGGPRSRCGPLVAAPLSRGRARDGADGAEGGRAVAETATSCGRFGHRASQ